MERIKVFYKGAYDGGDYRHYVWADDKDDYLFINRRQWLNCLKKRMIDGEAGIKFNTKKPVYAEDEILK